MGVGVALNKATTKPASGTIDLWGSASKMG